MVLYVGLDLVFEWLVLSVKRLSWVDWGIVVAIVAVVEFVGFLEGVAVGLLATIVHFVVTYSRTGAIRHMFTGREMRSTVERSTAERVALEDVQHGILLIKLQGYVFFASTVGLVDSVSNRLTDPDRNVTHLIIDFEHVTGVDASGFNGFDKLVRLATAQSVAVAYAALPDRLAHDFDLAARYRNGGSGVQRFASSDDALEWCEDDLLRRAGLDPESAEFSFDYTLREMFRDSGQLDVFTDALELLDVPAGTTIAVSDRSAAHLDFIERGTLTVVSSHDERTRIRRAGPGSVLGIASFFKHGGPSSLVTIRADTDCRVHRLGNDAYFDLVAQHPEVAAALQRYALVAISDRFADLVTSYELVLRGKA
jgi:SulP family sulfate permease